MHKERHNLFELEFKLTPRSPLLVKAGGISPDPSLPDMQFVRTHVNGVETVYIPGSSLKGIFRSYVEKVLRTKRGNKGACDLFEKSCANEIEDKEPGYEKYRRSCMACKIFGSTKLKSRIYFTDAYPSDEIKTETRYGVAISRLTHAVAQGPFEMEVAVSGSFKSRLYLANFELWQLGALALAIKGLNEGLIRVGFGKNRGFGEVSIDIENIKFTFASDLPENEIRGIGEFVSEEYQERYGFLSRDTMQLKVKPGKEEDGIIYKRREYPKDAWEEISDKAILKLKEALSS